MAGQAGWYNAPGEEGQLRYWNGTTWTDHRQPTPVEVPAVAETVAAEPIAETVAAEPVAQTTAPDATGEQSPPVEELDPFEQLLAEPTPVIEHDLSMDQFEKQFAASHHSVLDFEPDLGEQAAGDETARDDVPVGDAPLVDAPVDESSIPPIEPTPAALPFPPADTPAAPLPTAPVQETPPLSPFTPAGASSTAPPAFATPAAESSPSAPSFASEQQQSPVLEANPLLSPISDYSPPALAPEAPGSLAGAPAPFAMPSAEPAESPSLANAPAPEAPVSGQPTAAPFAPPAPFAAASSAAPSSASSFAAAPAAPDSATTGVPAPTLVDPDPAATRKRRSLIAAGRGLIVGLVVILIGVGLMYYLGTQSSSVAAGQGKTIGIVTNLKSSGGSCSPEARFAAPGGSFTATSASALTPCQFSLGQTVDVVYTTATPSTTGHVVVPNPLALYSWVVPVVGGVIFLVSLFLFIVRAGSVASGIRLIRDGAPARRRTAAPVA